MKIAIDLKLLWRGTLIVLFLLLPVHVMSAVTAGNGKTPGKQYPNSQQLRSNTGHPHIAYWFLNPEMLLNDNYEKFLKHIADSSKFNFIFLTAREGLNFYDFDRMHPVFSKIVALAHRRNIKIGLQLWEDTTTNIAIQNTEREISEGEINLDDNGRATYTGVAKHIRIMKLLIKSDLLKVYLFKKVNDGSYDPASLRDITESCKWISPDKGSVTVEINEGQRYKGYTAYILTQHYFNYSSNHSQDASFRFRNALKAYSDIPFDGVGLDEYTNLRVTPVKDLIKVNEVFRERPYSLGMDEDFKTEFGGDLKRALFDMRYAPAGMSGVRIAAINKYFDVLRNGTLKVENSVYQDARDIYGQKTFAGLHDTHHNALSGDEIWQTGLNWWRIPREYGQTDEMTPTPTQMGIAKSYRGNVLYNMYYNAKADQLAAKALSDLRYGIRTHYHAFNDVQGWGVSLENPNALHLINKVESCAALLDQFNPDLPETRLLIVFGMEALSNWYPNETDRGTMDINDKLQIEEKAVQVWKTGYLNALVPSDNIENDNLKLDKDGKPVMNGHTFDAIIYLYPQYAKEKTIRFLENYLKHHGKLMIAGPATTNFNGQDISERFNKIIGQATVKDFSVDAIPTLGVQKNTIPGGCLSEDGSYVFTDYNSLKNESSTTFKVTIQGDTYEATFSGLAAINANKQDGLTKFAAMGFKELSRNGEVLLSFGSPVELLVRRVSGKMEWVVKTPGLGPVINKLR